MGQRNPHLYLVGEQLNQHHDAALDIRHLVDTFDTGKRRFGQAHALAWLKGRLKVQANQHTSASDD
jgi:hypothetical protein